MMNKWEINLNSLLVLILSAILLGAFGIQIFKHEGPCPLCLLQRLGMIGVACGALLNVKFGVRPAHYGLSLLSVLLGGFVALRQIALHVCPDFSEFGEPFWGLSLYTWSFLVFVSTVAYIGLLLLIFDHRERPAGDAPINWFGQLAFALIFIAAVGNVGVSFWLCGLGPCFG